ncbi:MAG: adenylate/guanylate cyclase domain-containing protein [Acidimicrobiia bacterium]
MTAAGSEPEGIGPKSAPPDHHRLGLAAGFLLLPLLGLALLIARPELDGVWEHHPSHFWLVLAAGGINAALAYGTAGAAHRRGDARIFLISLSFLSAAGFLGLHALATPGVMLATANAGFALATPIGLVVSSLFAAASSAQPDRGMARSIIRKAQVLRAALVALMLAWAVASLARWGPLDNPAAPERASGSLLILAAVGVLLYCVAVARYLRIPRHHASPLPLAMAAAYTLLAEALVAVAWGRNWHVSWWEWHLLMLIAFVIVAVAAQRSWRDERWSGLYLPDTAAAEREVSVVFADLHGFTGFSEDHHPQSVAGMLNTYYTEVIPPVVDRYGGEIDRLIGDAIMATFNASGNQPDHARRACGAAVAIQETADEVARAHPTWPRFRIGVNTGSVVAGVLGTAGGRTFTVIGDAVNVAARLQAKAGPGEVVIAGHTLRRIEGAKVESLGRIEVKGRSEPVEAYRLLALTAVD